MQTLKAVIFDFIGTLTNVKGYDLENSRKKLCKTIIESGFNVEGEKFLEAYAKSHEKYRIIRYQKFVEITNAVWIADALNSLGFKTSPDDKRIKVAVNSFFEDYVKSFEIRPCVKKFLETLSLEYKLGLVSNFTYAPVIYAGLRKLGISKFFNTVLVSDAIGLRKPHTKIFEEALRRLNVKADEVIYVGDSPLEDIKGAKETGMKTVFVLSQFFSMEDLKKSQIEPEAIAKNICELYRKFSKFKQSLKVQ